MREKYLVSLAAAALLWSWPLAAPAQEPPKKQVDEAFKKKG